MTKTFYSIDRSPEAVAKHGKPHLEAWTVLAARTGFVAARPSQRQALTARDAGALCKQLHGCTLAEALVKGLI